MVSSHFPLTLAVSRRTDRDGFTLLELLVVMLVVGILITAMTATINGMFENARETRTTATLQKIDGLIADRQKGMERAFAGTTFKQFVRKQHLTRTYQGYSFTVMVAVTGGGPVSVPVNLQRVPGLSEKASEILARKDWQRYYMPQSFGDYIIAARLMGLNEDKNDDGIPDRLAGSFTLASHNPKTESAEMLYFALTELEVFGTPPVGEDAFNTQEAQDTDGDGLLEIVDGWDQPVRFYRWPTRLIKPYGLAGIDRKPGEAGVDDDGYVYSNGSPQTDDILELSTPGTDDMDVSASQRVYAGLYFSGLPRKPTVPGQYDLLNEEPEDPYGLILAEVKRLGVNGINSTDILSEALYHTIDTYHKPLVVSSGSDGTLGLLEPNHNEDANFNGTLDSGEDANGNNYLDIGGLGQVPVDATGAFTNLDFALDDLTNRNRRAGGG
ncbi:MAG: prepilin-type N-terminal cleavage/methylation domain-containing protein [Planctomycetaceae bacterium]